MICLMPMYVWYRCFDSKKGWLGWACNGADAGATIPGSFLKAVEVRIISKGSGAPGVTDGALFPILPPIALMLFIRPIPLAVGGFHLF